MDKEQFEVEIEYVKIPVYQLTNLLKDSDELSALKRGGVDNWQWYCESLNDYFDDDKDYEEIVKRNYEVIK